MNKITEEDLKNLFDDELDQIAPDESWHGFTESKVEKINVRKQTKKESEYKNIRKIRREINSIKQKKLTQKSQNIDSFLKFFAFFGLVGCIFFVLMNFSGYSKQFQWLYYHEYLNEQLPKSQATATPEMTAVVENIPVLDAPEINYDENKLIIDKLQMNGSIIWDVAENNIVEKLKDGIVHYQGTSKPGEGGNVFLVGHSSNYAWIQSDYNSVFALLDKLVKGDRIELRRAGKSYYYEVMETKIVNPDQVEVISGTNKEILSLMTCWPVGTTLNRLVVIAELKYSSSWVN